MSINAIIIDDELMARNLLHGMLTEFCPQISIVDMCADLPSGVLAIRKLQPDLVFLDIEMPGFSGLEILNFFSEEEINFGIIFTTSYNEYAVQAFKLSATDYLLKPIEPEDLINSVKLFEKKSRPFNYEQLRESLAVEVVKKIPIHTTNSILYVELNKIMFLKAEGAYTKIFFTNDTHVLASKGLKYFESLLESEKIFLRTHKSYIANINHVNELVKSNGGYLKIQQHEVNITQDKISVFMELMKI